MASSSSAPQLASAPAPAPLPPQDDLVGSLPFFILCQCFDKIVRAKKSEQKKRVLTELWKKVGTTRTPDGKRQKNNLFRLMRLIIPEFDRERSYLIKEKSIGKLYIESIGLPAKGRDAERIEKYRDPRIIETGGVSTVTSGDFATVLFDVIRNRCPAKNQHSTIDDVNAVLEKLVAAENKDERKGIFTNVVRHYTAKQQYWIVRIILKDLKLGIGHDSILKEFHRNALDMYNNCSNLQKVCAMVADPERSKQTNQVFIEFGQPIRPMLANRKDWRDIMKAMAGHPFAIELKFDGERIQIHFRRNGELKLFTRNSLDYTSKFGYGAALQDIINECIACESCILDGEVVTWNRTTQSIEPFGGNRTVALNKIDGSDDEGKHLCYMAFDILMLNDNIVMGLPLAKRRKLLERIVRPKSHYFELVEQSTDRTDQHGVMKALDEALEMRHEGIMVKNLDTPYIPDDRSTKWLKLKPDYVDSMLGHMDLIVMGGYFGKGSRRAGQISHFLLGLAHENYSKSKKRPMYHSFCKVGTGYSLEELKKLHMKLRDHWRTYDSKKRLEQWFGWAPTADDIPDVWIEPRHSVLVELLGNEIVPCVRSKFHAEHTVRFPRAKRFRWDKSWRECMTIHEMIAIRQQSSRTKKRAADISIEQQPKDGAAKSKKKRRSEVTMPARYIRTDISDVKVKGKIFADKEFCVISESNEHSKPLVERTIAEYGGRFVANPSERTDLILCGKECLKYENLKSSGIFNIVRLKWIFDCVEKAHWVELEPRHLMFATRATEALLSKTIDPYGDRYATDADLETLQESFKIVSRKHPELRNDESKSAASAAEGIPRGGLNVVKNWLNPDKYSLDVDEQDILENCFSIFSRYVFYLDKWKSLDGDGDPVYCSPLDTTECAIELYGGSVVRTLHRGVTHVVVDNESSKVKRPRIKRIFERLSELNADPLTSHRKHVVTRGWVDACILQRTIVDEHEFAPRHKAQSMKLSSAKKPETNGSSSNAEKHSKFVDPSRMVDEDGDGKHVHMVDEA